MAPFQIKLSAAVSTLVFLTACVSNDIDVNVKEAKTVKVATAPAAPKAPKEYLSKIVLKEGPCPERDPASYGQIMRSKTQVSDGMLHCYYN